MNILSISADSPLNDLIGQLSQLDTSAIKYLISSLQKVERKKVQDEQQFWNFIKKIDWLKTNREDQLQPLITALQATEVEVIHEFSEQLAYRLHQLDDPKLYEVLQHQQNGLSSDTFLYTSATSPK